MKKKRFWIVKPINIYLIVLCLTLTVILYFTNSLIFFISLPFVLAGVIFSAYRLWYIENNIYKIVTAIGKTVSDSHGTSMIEFPIPTLIVSGYNEVMWYNDSFKNNLLKSMNDIFGTQLEDTFDKSIYELGANQGAVIEFDNCFYQTYSMKATDDTNPMFVVYFVDITELQRNMEISKKKQPVVMTVLIDNYDEVCGNSNDYQSSTIIAQARNVIQEFINQSTGIIKRLDKDRYIVVVEKQDFDVMVENRFDILDKVREIQNENGIPITLSIGVSVAHESFSQAESEALLALDMALGRGGDQAVVKMNEGYEFFGGHFKGVEKRTKVKTRIVANALKELIETSDNVLIMGHKFADLDALGAAIGMAKAVECFGKPVRIILDKHKNLAGSLIDRFEEMEKSHLIVSPDTATDLQDDSTLVIVVDTHIKNLVECEEVYKRAKNIVVIDHHRKAVNHIDNAVIFYHEPYASSACEMVAELVQYLGEECKISTFEAEALLSGVMLDTKNFIMRTGVRTFEAAAYLRRMGADTVAVRQLFSSSIDAYQKKTRVVASAEIYKDSAISICDFNSEDIRIIAPQAADELLNISGVQASFVMFEDNDSINLSARSMGEMNVQVIMEKMGGGGHQTMAGTQIKGASYDKVRQTLLEILDEYSKENR